MTYEEWFLNQAKLHKTIMNKLEDKSADEIMEYFKYENMKQKGDLFMLNKKLMDSVSEKEGAKKR